MDEMNKALVAFVIRVSEDRGATEAELKAMASIAGDLLKN